MSKMANRKYIMAEPVWKWSECQDDPALTEWMWVKAVHWYRCNADIKKKKNWVLQYVKSHLPKESVSDYRNAKQSLYEEAGCFCKVKMTGCKNGVLDGKISSMLSDIKESCAKQNAKVSTPSTKKKSDAYRVVKKCPSDKNADACTEIGQIVDKFIVSGHSANKKDWFSLSDWISRNRPSQEQVSNLLIEMKSLYNEILSAYQKEDKQIVEAYSFLKQKELIRVKDFVKSLVDDCETFSDSCDVKKTTKKKISPEKMVSKLPHKDSMPEYGIKGIDPKKIIGSNSLFVYNSVSRLIMYYQAKPGNGGLEVNGASITHYDEKASFMKKVRSPKHTLGIVSRLTKKHVLEEIEKITTAKREIRPRLNKNCVIIRVI